MNVLSYLTGTGGTLTDILSSATEVLTWIITGMGSMLTFVTSNPAVLILFLVGLAGAVVGFLFRVWHSA